MYDSILPFFFGIFYAGPVSSYIVLFVFVSKISRLAATFHFHKVGLFVAKCYSTEKNGYSIA